MKPARQFGPLPHVRYRPELTTCPHCGTDLVYSHPVWAKPIQFLGGIEHISNLEFRCSNPACAFGRTVYRSATAEARQVKGSGYGLDVVVRIGHVRFGSHRTREEIWRHLQAVGVRISERHVQNMLEVYLALLRVSERDVATRLTVVATEHGGIIVALDGLQPEKGNDQFWLVREVLSGTVLAAETMREASAPALCTLLRPVTEVGVPVLGVISDAQESIRLAVAASFLNVPHQLCQFHVLRDAALPLWEADRHLLVDAKKGLAKVREVERRLQRQERHEVIDEVVGDVELALRQVTREHGTAPLDFAGLRVMEALSAIGQTLEAHRVVAIGSPQDADQGIASPVERTMAMRAWFACVVGLVPVALPSISARKVASYAMLARSRLMRWLSLSNGQADTEKENDHHHGDSTSDI